MTIIAGNWKMNHDSESCVSFLEEFESYGKIPKGIKAVVFPTFLCLDSFLKKSLTIEVGAQNGYWKKDGAFTGEISIFDLKNMNINWLLVGHSERRHIFGEGSDFLKKKVEASLSLGIKTVYCIGETMAEKKDGRTEDALKDQLSSVGDFLSDENLMIAYEPVWAIGSGIPAGSEDANEASDLCKKFCGRDVPVLYGGSVNSKNISNYLESGLVNGFLVGGASLNARSYRDLIDAVVN